MSEPLPRTADLAPRPAAYEDYDATQLAILCYRLMSWHAKASAVGWTELANDLQAAASIISENAGACGHA